MKTKLVIDYPMKYADCKYGDVNFVLAPLYRDCGSYAMKIQQANKPLMLDNGAWEFGKSMNVKQYVKILDELQPEYAVIPDAYKNRKLTEDLTLEFFMEYLQRDLPKTRLMFAPQGETVDELIYCYNEVMTQFASHINIIAIPKHVGELLNRIAFTDILYDSAVEPFHDVHFLGYWNWEELRFSPKVGSRWVLHSIDTKAPVKYAFLPEEFHTQMEYYETTASLDMDFLEEAIGTFGGLLQGCRLD